MRAILRLLAVAAIAALASGCATTRAPDPRDPLEGMNRGIFEFNETVDKFAIKPVAEGYRAILPGIVRTGVRNFYGNLRDVWTGVNNLLQGKVERGLTDGFRVIANSTFGIAGVFDIATDMGMEKHFEDFGQTLGVWGLDTGPYLVIPLWGPSSVRDGVGLIADAYAYLPWYLPEWLDASHYVAWRNSLFALDFVQQRAGLLDTTNLLEEAALDKYAFVRNAYFQRRLNQVYDGDPPPEKMRREPNALTPSSLETELAREPAALKSGGPEVFGVVPDANPYGRRDPPTPAISTVEPKVPANYNAVLAAGRSAIAAVPPRD